jgi:MFS family permease
MHRRSFTGLILASALITLDGTATTIALPTIGRELGAKVSLLQWISNAPLLSLAAFLLPAGTLADRFGRVRVMRIGLVGCVVTLLACAAAQSPIHLVAARFALGAAGALVLPAALAVLRGATEDAAERARTFGVWAAWTGVASACGPLFAGMIVDAWSWRAVFLPAAAAGLVAAILLETERREDRAAPSQPLPALATAALAVSFGAIAYVLMRVGDAAGLGGWQVGLPVGLAIGGVAVLVRDRKRHVLLPPELLTAPNCVPANAATFALYFGMFGLSFLVALYAQQVLRYSALWSAVVLLPISMMLFLAERFGQLTSRVGTRWLIVAGAIAAAGGAAWMASGPQPLPFWSHLIVGTALFGLGMSLAVSALTHAAVAAVPEACAGVASGLNHAVVRAAGLMAIALLGTIAAPGLSEAVSEEGFQRAMMICAGVVGLGGVAAGVWVRNDAPGGLSSES